MVSLQAKRLHINTIWSFCLKQRVYTTGLIIHNLHTYGVLVYENGTIVTEMSQYKLIWMLQLLCCYNKQSYQFIRFFVKWYNLIDLLATYFSNGADKFSFLDDLSTGIDYSAMSFDVITAVYCQLSQPSHPLNFRATSFARLPKHGNGQGK